MEAEVGAWTHAGLDVDAWARNVFALTRRVAGVHRAGLALAEGGGRRLQFTASDRVNEGGVDWCHIDAFDDVPLNTAIRSGEPVLGSLDALGERYEAFIESHRTTATIAVAAIPFATEGRVVGGIVMFFDLPQPFDPQQQRELDHVGHQAGVTLQRARAAVARPLADVSDGPLFAGTAAAHVVPADPAAVSGSRRFLQQTLTDWGVDEETTDTAVLCLSELVTNALMHTQSGCVVQVSLEQGLVMTTVRDGGKVSRALTVPLEDQSQVHGRGLLLVDALAKRWGSELHEGGTTVWFVLEPGSEA
jgi:anti-sigma regulatory factor (Ser/Thr protein kinase)